MNAKNRLSGFLFTGLVVSLILVGHRSATAQRPESVEHREMRLVAPTDAPVPDGYMIIEGDIVVPENFYTQRGTYATNLWPGGVVPYEFDANVSAPDQAAMLVAMSDWELVANVDFRPRSGDPNFLHIRDASFNASEGVGMAGGSHDIWIFNWNFEFIMAHELGHALAFWHEQSRADRDSFVEINFRNICQTCCSGSSCDSQFTIRPNQGPQGSGEYALYDFDSVMHYGACFFSVCGSCSPFDPACRTITVLPPNDVIWQSQIGNRTHLSDMDELTMSFLYPQPNWRFVDINHIGNQNGTFLEPYVQFTVGEANTPGGGTLWIQPGTYSAVGTYSTPVTIRAPLGGVTLGN